MWESPQSPTLSPTREKGSIAGIFGSSIVSMGRKSTAYSDRLRHLRTRGTPDEGTPASAYFP